MVALVLKHIYTSLPVSISDLYRLGSKKNRKLTIQLNSSLFFLVLLYMLHLYIYHTPINALYMLPANVLQYFTFKKLKEEGKQV